MMNVVKVAFIALAASGAAQVVVGVSLGHVDGRMPHVQTGLLDSLCSCVVFH